MDLGELLTEFRKQNGISQREFARRCGLFHALISILEMGKNNQTGKKPTPDTETYKKLAAGMGITVQELFVKLGDTEMVNLQQSEAAPIVVPSSEKFVQIVKHMSVKDYRMVMEAFDRTYKKMKQEGIID